MLEWWYQEPSKNLDNLISERVFCKILEMQEFFSFAECSYDLIWLLYLHKYFYSNYRQNANLQLLVDAFDNTYTKKWKLGS